ncbi:collagen alpha-1(I) chain-like [Mustela erminea]|uniref:collagen alpha-1(I) chain-like n=1 Tax=Mustela erminea TaxID=36723 RepID=UPI00138674B2|nr:collagen alpha-1(I) chain-like [Mustela erminea]
MNWPGDAQKHPEPGGVDAAPAHTNSAPAWGTTAATGPAGCPGVAGAQAGGGRARSPAVRGPFLPTPPLPRPRARAHRPPPTQPRRPRTPPPAAARRSPPRRPALPLPGVPGGRGGLPGRRPEPPGPRSVRGGGGGASLTAQRLRAAPGPRGAPGIFFWETSPGSAGLSLPGRKSAQRREAATIRELRGDVNPPPRLPVPPTHPAPAAPPHVDAPRGRRRPFALSSGRRARPACPPARLCAPPPRVPQSRVARVQSGEAGARGFLRARPCAVKHAAVGSGTSVCRRAGSGRLGPALKAPGPKEKLTLTRTTQILERVRLKTTTRYDQGNHHLIICWNSKAVYPFE